MEKGERDNIHFKKYKAILEIFKNHYIYIYIEVI